MSWDIDNKTYTESYHILKFEESEDGKFEPIFTNVLTCKHEVWGKGGKQKEASISLRSSQSPGMGRRVTGKISVILSWQQDSHHQDSLQGTELQSWDTCVSRRQWILSRKQLIPPTVFQTREENGMLYNDSSYRIPKIKIKYRKNFCFLLKGHHCPILLAQEESFRGATWKAARWCTTQRFLYVNICVNTRGLRQSSNY